MFNWFGRKKENIEFADTDAAFAHACGIGYRPLIDALIPALVVEEGERGRDGEHSYRIRLADQHGETTLWCSTLKGAQGHPKPGDLVGFRIVTIASDLPEEASLIGYLACRLRPVLVAGKGWAVAENYTPDNLKPAIRLG